MFDPIRLASNAGYASLAIEPLGAARIDDVDGFDVGVVIRAPHWRDAGPHESVVRIERVWLVSNGLRMLIEHVATWLAHPLAERDPRQLDGVFELAGFPGQELRIAFGARVDTIADRNPVVTISFGAGALHGEFHFVTDPSCLALFVASLKELWVTALA